MSGPGENTAFASANSLPYQDTAGSLGTIMSAAAQLTPAVMGYFQNQKAKELADIERGKLIDLDKDLQNLLANRQDLRNPYANLGVATQAAEFEAQQADASLANTLDTMRAGGMGASGATALAREAAKAKQGIGSDIQKQEQANQTKFAEGEAALQTAMEQRQTADINRAQTLADNARMDMQDFEMAGMQAAQTGVGQTATGFANMLSSNPDMFSGLFQQKKYDEYFNPE